MHRQKVVDVATIVLTDVHSWEHVGPDVCEVISQSPSWTKPAKLSITLTSGRLIYLIAEQVEELAQRAEAAELPALAGVLRNANWQHPAGLTITEGNARREIVIALMNVARHCEQKPGELWDTYRQRMRYIQKLADLLVSRPPLILRIKPDPDAL